MSAKSQVDSLVTMRLSLMPVREVIHSSEVSSVLDKSSLVTIFGGKYLNYIGFIEGDDIYKGSVDLVVCDGFDGNRCDSNSSSSTNMISADCDEWT
jgi:glycerol-3-phosphate acyltransferase PlsX